MAPVKPTFSDRWRDMSPAQRVENVRRWTAEGRTERGIAELVGVSVFEIRCLKRRAQETEEPSRKAPA